MNITLPEDQMRQIVTKAILEGLGDEQKTLIMTAAVEHLLGQPEERGYHHNQDKRNRLQRIFDQAAEFAMQQVAREEFAKPENVARLREILGPILTNVLGEPGAYLMRSAVGDAIGKAFENQKGT
jgi:hypothetical protein